MYWELELDSIYVQFMSYTGFSYSECAVLVYKSKIGVESGTHVSVYNTLVHSTN